MVLLKLGENFADHELKMLSKLLGLLDTQLRQVNAEIAATSDPDSAGLLDAGEFLIGSGFVAIQRYLTATRCSLHLSQTEAYRIPPHVTAEVTLAQACHDVANYWKHGEEWFQKFASGGEEASIGKPGEYTVERLEKLAPFLIDYPSAQYLSILLCGGELLMSRLLPRLAVWRNNVWSLRRMPL